MKYIFVAYKPDSADYCMNQLMASYGSDLTTYETENKEELLLIWAATLKQNAFMKKGEAKYEIQLFLGQKCLCEADCDCQYWILKELETEVTALAVTLIEEKKTKDKAKQDRENADREERKRQERLTDFNKLKAEFMPQTD